MKIYWSRNSFPEFDGVSEADRDLAWDYSYRRSLKNWKGWTGLLACGLCAGAGRYFFGIWGLVIGNLVGFFLLHQSISSSRRVYIIEFLKNRESWSLFPAIKANQQKEVEQGGDGDAEEAV